MNSCKAWFATYLLSFLCMPLCLSAFAQTAGTPVRFTDITQAAGIHFEHTNGAFGGKYLPEALGPGCAFIDYDNDGYPDILIVNGQDFPGHGRSQSTLKLY